LSHSDERELRTTPGQTQAALGRAVTYIEAHLADRLAIAEIARASGLSTRSLTRLFRKEIGSTIVNFILRRRIARARQLLQHEGQTCAEIAFQCGFGSVQHFNRIFRRHENVSPSRWRAVTKQARLGS